MCVLCCVVCGVVCGMRICHLCVCLAWCVASVSCVVRCVLCVVWHQFCMYAVLLCGPHLFSGVCWGLCCVCHVSIVVFLSVLSWCVCLFVLFEVVWYSVFCPEHGRVFAIRVCVLIFRRLCVYCFVYCVVCCLFCSLMGLCVYIYVVLCTHVFVFVQC